MRFFLSVLIVCVVAFWVGAGVKLLVRATGQVDRMESIVSQIAGTERGCK